MLGKPQLETAVETGRPPSPQILRILPCTLKIRRFRGASGKLAKPHCRTTPPGCCFNSLLQCAQGSFRNVCFQEAWRAVRARGLRIQGGCAGDSAALGGMPVVTLQKTSKAQSKVGAGPETNSSAELLKSETKTALRYVRNQVHHLHHPKSSTSTGTILKAQRQDLSVICRPVCPHPSLCCNG